MSSCILWFRQDFRLHDNPALRAALAAHETVHPVFILDDGAAGAWRRGAASRVWLHHALEDLQRALGGRLTVLRGDAGRVLEEVAARTGVQTVYWNRCYEPWRIRRDADIKKMLEEQSIVAKSSNSALLWEPWQVKKTDGTPYRVFTPFYRKGCLGAAEPPAPLPPPDAAELARLAEVPADMDGNAGIDGLGLLPLHPRWDTPMIAHWRIGEDGALARLEAFIADGLRGYKDGRDRPDRTHVSRLSPYLHFGHISPRLVWARVRQAQAAGDVPERDADGFLSEMGWREFSHSLLYYNPGLPEQPLQEKFAAFPWAAEDGGAALAAWQAGRTGYPIVDAGMRQLWQTGWMHNRVRMIVASFLVKDLMIPWQAGEAWFWDCLVDADLANNAASWQWVAGCGADAAPYFRIFNPVTQGQKFDPDGAYVRRYVPEIAALPDRYIHAPWEAPEAVLRHCGVEPGRDYPKPIVDHGAARERALAAFKGL